MKYALHALSVALLVAGGAMYWADTEPAQAQSAAPKHSDMQELDAFRASLGPILMHSPAAFNLADLAARLGAIRAGGYAVCAPDEITAAQYLDLAEIADVLMSAAPSVAAQLNAILDGDQLLTDCHFRVLEVATMGLVARSETL